MDFNALTPFPAWEDEKYDSEEGNEWKSAIKNEKAKKLYNQWLQVFVLVEGLQESLRTIDEQADDPLQISDEFLEHMKQMMLADATIIPAKISGAEAGDLYVLRMENAAIIRKAANDVYMQCASFATMGVADDDVTEAVRKEIELFRTYFQEWVANFERDEFEDEWGLF